MDNEKNNLSRQQKTGFVLLLVFGILAVGLGMLQMRNTIYLPFVTQASGDTKIEVGSMLDDKTRLQQIDTDQDGLNDYEELNFYQTSPYLEDSDSDGIDDKTEIEKGTDPLCPTGKNCGTVETGGNKPTIASTTGVVSLPTVDTAVNMTTSTGASSDVLSLVKDPKALRELLSQSGKFTPEQLEVIDDATLLKMASEALNK